MCYPETIKAGSNLNKYLLNGSIKVHGVGAVTKT